MFTAFTDQFCQEIELVLSILNLVLLYTTEDHSVQRRQVLIIVLGRFLENIISSLVVTKQAFLMADFVLILGVLGCKHNGLVQYLQRLVQHHLVPAAVARKKPRNVIEKISVFILKLPHRIKQLIHVFFDKVPVALLSHQIKHINPQRFNVGLISDEYLLDKVLGLIPFVV